MGSVELVLVKYDVDSTVEVSICFRNKHNFNFNGLQGRNGNRQALIFNTLEIESDFWGWGQYVLDEQSELLDFVVNCDDLIARNQNLHVFKIHFEDSRLH